MKPNTPIREFLLSRLLDLDHLNDRKKGAQLIFNGDMDLVIKNEFIYDLLTRINSIIWSLWALLYSGSETEWEFHQDFPPHLHPEFHDHPPFGFYPLTIIK